MPNAAVMTVFWLNPLVAIALAFLLLGERPGVRDIILVVAGWAAIAMAFEPPRPSGLGGPAYAIAMTGCYSLYLVGTRWLRREPTAVNLFYSAFVVFLVLTPIMPFVWVTPPISALPRIVAIGALGLLLLFLIDRALHHATVARTAPAGFLQPAVELLLFGAASGALATNVARAGLLIALFVVSLCVLMGARTTTELTTAGHD
jgi:drug/metabolite transporter (DMT)-like permease